MSAVTIHEARIADQARCSHRNCGWGVLQPESGRGQIRWACLDCGCRTMDDSHSCAQPYAAHPDHASYPLLIPNARRYDVPDDYASYLRSEDWCVRADAAKARAGYRCQLCNSSRGLHAHHRTYERLGRELESDLVVLCEPCHELFSRHGRLVKWREEFAPEQSRSPGVMTPGLPKNDLPKGDYECAKRPYHAPRQQPGLTSARATR